MRDGGADQRGGREPRLELRVPGVEHAARQVVRGVRFLAPQRLGVQHLAGDAETGEDARPLGGGGQLLLGLGDDDAALAVVLEVVRELARRARPTPRPSAAPVAARARAPCPTPARCPHTRPSCRSRRRSGRSAARERPRRPAGRRRPRPRSRHPPRPRRDCDRSSASVHPRDCRGPGHHHNVQDRGGPLRGMSKTRRLSDIRSISPPPGFDILPLRASVSPLILRHKGTLGPREGCVLTVGPVRRGAGTHRSRRAVRTSAEAPARSAGQRRDSRPKRTSASIVRAATRSGSTGSRGAPGAQLSARFELARHDMAREPHADRDRGHAVAGDPGQLRRQPARDPLALRVIAGPHRDRRVAALARGQGDRGLRVRRLDDRQHGPRRRRDEAADRRRSRRRSPSAPRTSRRARRSRAGRRRSPPRAPRRPPARASGPTSVAGSRGSPTVSAAAPAASASTSPGTAPATVTIRPAAGGMAPARGERRPQRRLDDLRARRPVEHEQRSAPRRRRELDHAPADRVQLGGVSPHGRS